MAVSAPFTLPVGSHAAQEPTFKNEVHLIDFTFSVRRADGTLVGGLTQDDFQITEDGVPQKIAFFGREKDLPLTLGLIVDVSDSQSKFIKRHYKDIEKFLATVLEPHDEAFALCFGNHLRLTNDASSSIPAIMGGLQRFDKGDRNFPELAQEDKRDDQSGGGTALYDAVFYSVQQNLPVPRDTGVRSFSSPTARRMQVPTTCLMPSAQRRMPTR